MGTHSDIRAQKSHGQKSLEGQNPWGDKEGDRTEQDHYPGLDKGKNLMAVEGWTYFLHTDCFTVARFRLEQGYGVQNRDMGLQEVVAEEPHGGQTEERKKPAKRETAGPE